ncbi:MAG TPA: DUF4350 domain-containing protein [Sphingomicrobium sp.]|jgi:hypothetical protein|nr:DUF4350 domain-containing protein [Sphingomicrobium sp.]
MTRARLGALLTICAVIAGAVALAADFNKGEPPPLPPRRPSERPTLLLLTSLPLLFSEDFSVQQNGSAALKALETRYRVVPISVSDPGELAKGSLLLMAQPQAQPPEDLVALDAWVRRGGRVLLFADPMLEWPSKRPLGDRLRPAAMFADTGLLAHWGLRLDAPDWRGARQGKLGGYDIATSSSGSLFGKCEISSDRLVAHCRIGNGRATIVADADLLDMPRLGRDATHNLDAVLEELEALEQS